MMSFTVKGQERILTFKVQTSNIITSRLPCG
jgi:hypothetical protein